jgi:hypothetical protein
VVKHIDCIQNQEEWWREKVGKPSASEFSKILTTKLALSQSRFSYMYRLIWERLYRKRSNTVQTYWMARGNSLEPMAAAACEQKMGTKLKRVGLCTTDDRRIVCSPDRIVDWKHAVEIKCPHPWLHIQYSVMGPESDYYQQIHGIMYVGGFERVSFFSFCPGMPCVVHEIARNEKVMKVMDTVLPLFADELDKHYVKALELGSYNEEAMESEVAWE